MVPLMVPLGGGRGDQCPGGEHPYGAGGQPAPAVSPVSAVVMIVAGSVKRSPIEVVKRTSLPMIAGVVFCSFFP